MIECTRMSDNLLDPQVWAGEIRTDTNTGRTMWTVQRKGDKTALDWQQAANVKEARKAVATQLKEWGIEGGEIED